MDETLRPVPAAMVDPGEGDAEIGGAGGGGGATSSGHRGDVAAGRAVGSAAMTDGTEVAPGLLYDVDGAVARLVINRPERRNALTWELVGAMRTALADADADPAVRVVVLGGAGDRAFCAGADLGGMAGGDSVALHEARGQLAGLFGDLWSLGKPTVASVRGYALAGGFGLALSCDLVVAAADAVFGAPEIDVGLWPFMITVPMVRAMPPKRALELMMTGRRVDAAEAEAIGFVTSVVPVAELDTAVASLAATLADKPPAAMRIGRRAFYATIDLAADEALAQLHPLLGIVADGSEATEGMAAFHDKRPPAWRSGGGASS
jgi:enoyl-CoA hydratase/carnithine racemase